MELLFDLIWKCLELDPAKRITAEQAKEHNFFYAMKHIKPSIITLYVLGNHLDLDDDSWELSEEETRVHLPPTTITKSPSKLSATRTPLRNITNALHVK